MSRSYLVTGGSGFIGASLVKRLVRDGHRVRVLDNLSRGKASRLSELEGKIEFIEADIRDASAVSGALQGMDGVFHLAFVNGTEFFYSKPDLVLDVGVRGMLSVIEGCFKNNVRELILASSSEVYQTPPSVPTDETVPLSIPDPSNPRYSYGGAKLINELMAFNYGRDFFKRLLIFRPHNVYGPDMGWEHVLPQFVLRMKRLCENSSGVVKFPLQGDGRQTRSFIYIDDFTEGLLCVTAKGEHRNIYHIGTQEEVSMGEVARLVGRTFGREIELVPGKEAAGGTPRRCPDIGKLSKLGFKSKISLSEGMPKICDWYKENASLQPIKSGEILK